MSKRGCIWNCRPKDPTKAIRNGVRGTYFIPGGGTYKGYWLNNKRSGYGQQTDLKNRIYDGQWLNDKRHGFGSMRKILPDGSQETLYVGDFKNGLRHGEGKQFCSDGVYYGWWQNNGRDTLGIKWFNDGRVYVGEWGVNVPHGLGVFFEANGNRYEGHYARGFRNGIGTYYHMHTGQIQKGVWEDNICKSSIIMDGFRNVAEKPTESPIPKCQLADADNFIRELFAKKKFNADKPVKSLDELSLLQFVRKIRKYARLQPVAKPQTHHPIRLTQLPCTCTSIEQPISLSNQHKKFF